MPEAEAARRAVIERLFAAWNDHDLEAFLACFRPDYRSSWPLEPNLDFVGREHVRERWAANFAAMADFRAELLGLAIRGPEAWVELRWHGTRGDGSVFAYQGVIIYGVVGGHIGSARLYLHAPSEAADR